MVNVTAFVVGLLVAAPQGLPPRFALFATDPAAHVGRLNALAPDGTVTLTEPDHVGPPGTLVALRRSDRPLPSLPREPQVILANRDRVRATVVGGDADAVKLTPAFAPKDSWDVPLSSVAAVWVTPVPADMPLDPAVYPWAAGPRRQDAVLLRSGDVVRGVVEGFAGSPAAVRVKTADPTPVLLPLDRVSCVAFNPALARPRKLKGPFYRVTVADGSRFSALVVTADLRTLTATTAFGATVALPLAEVIALDVMQGKATYLSDLTPKAAVEPYNGVAWPWAADRTAKGLPLRLATPLGDQTFDKGLGTHPRTTLTYDLSGKYRRFEALVGLDPGTGRRGSARVRVLLDGKDVTPEAVAEHTHGPARAVSVDVTGGKQLVLVVDFGPAGDVQGDVNWCDARLVE